MSELEVRESSPTIARFFGRIPPDGAHMLAPDEWLLIGDAADIALAGSDQHVIDFSSGFVCLDLSGPAREEAFAYLSDLELPEERPAFAQGIVADVPTKVVADDEVLSLYVSPTFAHHVRHQISRLEQLTWTTLEVTPERALA